ncbi:MAG: hypothetical protein JWO58_1600 [Chitinophagaceae bacterium]|nr:hypothetical protein [Chitinophagaceae bacterium]
MNIKRTAWLSVVVLLVLLIIYLVYHMRSKKPLYYWRTTTVEKGDVNVLVTATGSMAADTSVDIGVQVSGTVAHINVDFNDHVKKGQVLAVLDTALYYAAKLDAQATLQRAQVALAEARREFVRAQKLFDNRVSARADYDQALSNYQTAQGNVTSAKAQLNKAIINLRYCTITAPISGVIMNRNTQVGNMVIASFNSPVLFTIAYDLRKMQVQADVDEADIGQIKEGQAAEFTVDTYPNEVFKGQVSQIRHQPVMVQNVVNYIVIIDVANPDLKLIPGLTANCNIFIAKRSNVKKIATNAFAFHPPVEYISQAPLMTDSMKTYWLHKIKSTEELQKRQIVEPIGVIGYLWIKKDNDVFPVSVIQGLNDGSFTEITSTLTEGTEVATGINHSAHAGDGQPAQNPFMPKFPTGKK